MTVHSIGVRGWLSGLTAILVLIGATSAAGSPAGAAPAAPAAPDGAEAGIIVQPNPAAADVSAEMMAAVQRDLKMTPERARARLVRSDWASRLTPLLQQRLGKAYAGSWLALDGQDFVVAITDRRLERVVRASGATPKLVARGEAELSALGDKLNNWAKKDPKSVPAEVTGWVVDPLINRVRIEVLPGGYSAGLRFATAAGLAAGEFEYTTMPGPWTQERDVKAGQEFFPVSTSFSRCSTGFAVTANPGTPFARPAYVTAAHCFRAFTDLAMVRNTRTGPSEPEFVVQGLVGAAVSSIEDDEALVHTEREFRPVPRVDGHGTLDIAVTGDTPAADNSMACTSAGVTGLQCGLIVPGAYSGRHIDGSIFLNHKATDTCSRDGDSGGAVFSGTQAQGVLVEGNVRRVGPLGFESMCAFPALRRTGYIPIRRALSNLGAQLRTVPAPKPPPTSSRRWVDDGQPWDGLGGSVLGNVASVALNAGHVQVFGRGTDNHLYTNTLTNGTWGGWQGFGGADALTGPPTVLARAGGIDVYYRGVDTRPYFRRFNGTSWEPPVKLGDIDVEGQIAAVNAQLGHVILFIRSSDDEVYYNFTDGVGPWSGWLGLGGNVNASPTAIARTNAAGQIVLEVYARWADDNVRYRTLDPAGPPGWGPWVNLGGIFKATPVGVTVGPNQSWLVGWGRDDDIVYVQRFKDGDWLRGSNGSTATGWRGLGGTAASPPTVVAGPGEQMRVFARDINQRIKMINWPGGDIYWERWVTLAGDTVQPVAVSPNYSGQVSLINAFGIDAATQEPFHIPITVARAVQVTVNSTAPTAPNVNSTTVGNPALFTITGPPGAPISWSATQNGVVREDHASYGHVLDGNGEFTWNAGELPGSAIGSWVRQAHVGTQNPRTAEVAYTVAPRPVSIVTDKAHYQLGENVTFMISGPANQPISWSSFINGSPSGENAAFYGQYTDASGLFSVTVPWTDSRLGFWTKFVNIAGQAGQVEFAVSNGSLAIYTKSAAYGFGDFINYMVAGPPNQPTFWTTWLNGTIIQNNVPGEPLDADGLLVTPEAPWIDFHNGTYVVQVSAGGQTAQVTFVFDWPQPIAYPPISASHSNKCLDIEGNTIDDGARALQWACVMGINVWRRSGSNLIAEHSGKCLEVSSGSSGAPAQQWTCNGDARQDWQFPVVGDWWNNQYKIVSAGSGMCLTVADASLADGAAVVQLPCNGSANQVWNIPDPIVPPAPPPGWDEPV